MYMGSVPRASLGMASVLSTRASQTYLSRSVMNALMSLSRRVGYAAHDMTGRPWTGPREVLCGNEGRSRGARGRAT